MFESLSLPKFLQRAFVFSLLAVSTSLSQADLIIDFDFAPQEAGDSVLTAENQAIFNDAADFWEAVLTGYQDGVSRTVTVNAVGFNEGIMNGGIILGEAGPTSATSFRDGPELFTIATEGIARFNVNPTALSAGGGNNGLLNPLVIRHELGHILGFGTIWNSGFNNLYDDGSGVYTGENGLAAYQNEFDPDATFVPIELDGGEGTADGHLNEVRDNFSDENVAGPDSDPGDDALAPTVLFGPNAGLSLDDALLSGVLSGDAFLTDTSLGIFRDLGFTTVDFRAVAIPEPSSAVLLVLLTGTALSRRRRS